MHNGTLHSTQADKTDKAQAETKNNPGMAQNFIHGAMSTSTTCAKMAKPEIWGNSFTKSG